MRLSIHCTATLLIVGLMFIAGCSTGPEAEELWPLQVGHRWIGSVEYFDGSGEKSFGTGYDTIEVIGAVEVDGETWYELNSGAMMRNGPQGTELRYSQNGIYSPPGLYMKYPSVRGDTFASFHSIIAGVDNPPTYFRRTEETDSVMALPFGAMRAYVYRSLVAPMDPNLAEFHYRYYEAAVPGIGIVYKYAPYSSVSGLNTDTSRLEWKLLRVDRR